jgi:hypothetical protein
MRTLSRIRKVTNVADIPRTGAYFILSLSQMFLGKSIQGFMRLFQWLWVSRDTDHIPNHGALLINGVVYEALGQGIVRHSIEESCNKPGTVYYLVEIIATEKEINDMLIFADLQRGENYRKFDVLRYIVLILLWFWPGKKEGLDRNKWTCYSFIASAYEFAMKNGIFGKKLWRVTPYEVCRVIDKETTLFK